MKKLLIVLLIMSCNVFADTDTTFTYDRRSSVDDEGTQHTQNCTTVCTNDMCDTNCM